MYILFFVLIFTFFILGMITSKNISNSSSCNPNLKLSDIAEYLKFLSVDKTRSIFNIAVHNFGLAITAYILSFLSSGLLGIIPICSSSFIGGITFCTSPKNVNNIFFVLLELSGMCLAVLAGTFFREKQKSSQWSITKIIILSIVLTIFLFLIYVMASCIENELLQSLWG